MNPEDLCSEKLGTLGGASFANYARLQAPSFAFMIVAVVTSSVSFVSWGGGGGGCVANHTLINLGPKPSTLDPRHPL